MGTQQGTRFGQPLMYGEQLGVDVDVDAAIEIAGKNVQLIGATVTRRGRLLGRWRRWDRMIAGVCRLRRARRGEWRRTTKFRCYYN